MIADKVRFRKRAGKTGNISLLISFSLRKGADMVAVEGNGRLTFDADFTREYGFQMVQTAIDFALQSNQGVVLVPDAFFSVSPVFLLAQATIHLFQKVSVRIYGHVEEIYIFHLDLLWKSTQDPLRFVFAKTSCGSIVLMCSSLDQNPIAAIELYCLRTRIEIMFDMLKNVLHIFFQCHFWSKKMSKHSMYYRLQPVVY